MVRAFRRRNGRSSSCRTIRPSVAEADSAWRSSGASSRNTVARSTSETTRRRERGLQSNCRVSDHVELRNRESTKPPGLGFVFSCFRVSAHVSSREAHDSHRRRRTRRSHRTERRPPRRRLQRRGCLERVTRGPVDLILLDVWLPGMDGLVTLQRLKERQVDAQIVLISGHGNIESAVRAIKMGAFDFVEKPLSLDKTVLVVNNALRQRRLEIENRALRAKVDRHQTMVGESYSLRQLREQVAMAAPTNGRVLIYGENGTGKELVARTVHALSRRRMGAFVEVNCAAIPEELIESELFGHVRGAFTGAVADRRGKFEVADGGTIFLDEIGDMSLKTQAKGLRPLPEHTPEPARGGSKTIKVDLS